MLTPRLVASAARRVTGASLFGIILKGVVRLTISFLMEWMSYFKMERDVKSIGLGISVGDEGLCLPHHLSCKTRVGEKYTGTMGPTVHAVSPRYCKFT